MNSLKGRRQIVNFPQASFPTPSTSIAPSKTPEHQRMNNNKIKLLAPISFDMDCFSGPRPGSISCGWSNRRPNQHQLNLTVQIFSCDRSIISIRWWGSNARDQNKSLQLSSLQANDVIAIVVRSRSDLGPNNS